jgi:hypothetical protein
MTVIAERVSYTPDPEGHGSLYQLPHIEQITDQRDALWEEAADVEAQVFIDCGYATKEKLTEKYAPYVARMTMMPLLVNGEVVGAARIADHTPEEGPYGFITLNDTTEDAPEDERLELSESGLQIVQGIDLPNTQEVVTISLKEEYRGAHGFGLVGHLYQGIHERAVERGYDSTIASFDERYFAGFRFRFRPAVRALGPAVMYMGSPTVPAHISIPQIDRAKLRFDPAAIHHAA